MALLSFIASYPTLIVVAITAKWIILGRIKPAAIRCGEIFIYVGGSSENYFIFWTFTI